jgi:hypothetical protein
MIELSFPVTCAARFPEKYVVRGIIRVNQAASSDLTDFLFASTEHPAGSRIGLEDSSIRSRQEYRVERMLK